MSKDPFWGGGKTASSLGVKLLATRKTFEFHEDSHLVLEY